jgi:hypothetical protein
VAAGCLEHVRITQREPRFNEDVDLPTFVCVSPTITTLKDRQAQLKKALVESVDGMGGVRTEFQCVEPVVSHVHLMTRDLQ